MDGIDDAVGFIGGGEALAIQNAVAGPVGQPL
jgi:hypothetical protein